MNHTLKLREVELLISRRRRQLMSIAERLGKDHLVVAGESLCQRCADAMGVA